MAETKFDEIYDQDLHLSYCRNFLNTKEAYDLLQACEKELVYDEDVRLKVFGKWCQIHRKQCSFGDNFMSYKFSGAEAKGRPWPDLLLPLKQRLLETTGIDFNFVLVNRYEDGNEYIGEHRDNEQDLDPNMPIASVSIGQRRPFVLRHQLVVKRQATVPAKKTLELEHGSLLLMRPPTNQFWYHSLPKRTRLPGVRINFTFRKLL